MLIRSQNQLQELNIIRHVNCAWCQQGLAYPRIVANDATATSYHIDCALQLATATLADMLELLHDPQAKDLVYQITVGNMLGGLPHVGRPQPPAK